jgi:transcriptional regulator with XRE-family HTH domain
MKVYANHAGKLVRNTRIERGMTQRALSTQMGWSVKNTQYLSNLERSVSPFPPKYADRMAHVLRIPKNTLISAMVKDFSDALSEY